jgi:hypothetical protein
MAIAPKPKKRNQESEQSVEKQAMDFIKQGGGHPQEAKPTAELKAPIYSKGRHTTKTDPDDQVSISVKLLISERNKINELRATRSARNKASLQDWIIEAINEKLIRDYKRLNKA